MLVRWSPIAARAGVRLARQSSRSARRHRKLQLEALEARRVFVGNAYAGQDQVVNEGEPVTLNGYQSGAYSNVTWQWTAKSSAGETLATGDESEFVFTPPDDGLYNVRLTLTDDEGATASDDVEIRAKNVAPTLTINGATKTAAGAPYQLALSSFDPGADTITSWTINWGDGTPPDVLPGNPSTATHVYAEASPRYAIVATAADEDATYAAARLGNTDVTRLDPAFGNGGETLTGFTAPVDSTADGVVVTQPDGKLLVTGQLLSTGQFTVARHTVDGTLDTTFGNAGTATFNFGTTAGRPFYVALDNSGRILVATRHFGIARLTADGALDTTFGSSGFAIADVNVDQVAIDSQQRIVFLAGSVGRLLPNGQVDSSFNGGIRQSTSITASEMALDASDRILLTGWPLDASGVNYTMAVSRLTTSGNLDQQFDVDGVALVNFAGLASLGGKIRVHDSKVYLMGSAFPRSGPGTSSSAFARLLDDGSLDVSFGNGGKFLVDLGSSAALDLKVSAGGKLYVTDESSWTRFNSNGVLELRQSLPSSLTAKTISVDANDRILIGGSWRAENRLQSEVVARYLPSGALDGNFGAADDDQLVGMVTTTYSNVTGESITSLVMNLPDGGSLVSGLRLAGTYAGVITRYTSQGTVDTTFGNGGSVVIAASSAIMISKLLVDAQGRILVLVDPNFPDMGSVLRFLSDGTPDNSFGAGPGNDTPSPIEAHDLAIAQDGSLIIAGNTYQAELGRNRVAFAKLDGETGLLNTAFGSNGLAITDLIAMGTSYDNYTIADMTIQPDGRILLAGTLIQSFKGSMNASHNMFVARFLPGGALDTSFAIGPSYDSDHAVVENLAGIMSADLNSTGVDSLAIDHKNRIIAAGNLFALRLLPDGRLDASFGNNGQTTTEVFTDDIVIDSHDRLILAGVQLGRLLENGSPDESFAPGGYMTFGRGRFKGVGLDSADRILGAGELVDAQQNGDFYLARLIPATSEIFVEVTSTGPTLTVPPLQVGANELTISGATPGSTVKLALGRLPGETILQPGNVKVKIDQATVVVSATVAANGTATLSLDLSATELADILFLQAFDSTAQHRLTNVVSVGSPLLTTNSGSETIAANVPPGLRAEALARWRNSGATAAQLAKLRSAIITMVDLPPGVLGQTVGTKIYLDTTANGNGWFVDTTPSASTEFSQQLSGVERIALGSSDAVGHIDMLTVLMHEMGHVINLVDLDAPHKNQLMTHALPISTRRIPTGSDPLDVSNDGSLNPIDALLIINRLNAGGLGAIHDEPSALCDVNQDGSVTPLDALLVINALNAGAFGGQGEAPLADEVAQPGSDFVSILTAAAAKAAATASPSTTTTSAADQLAYLLFSEEEVRSSKTRTPLVR
jgi:uncharacterized delta-60 repeat protein